MSQKMGLLKNVVKLIQMENFKGRKWYILANVGESEVLSKFSLGKRQRTRGELLNGTDPFSVPMHI